MPKNACAECRSRKIRCSPTESGQRCQQCAARNSVCSYMPPSGGRPSHHERLPSHMPINQVISPSPPAFEDSKFAFWTSQTQGFVLPNTNTGLDLGMGTPSEVLRETEFAQTLLFLYFSNFDDIHIMFEQTSFMQQFALGCVPKAQLFAMMALGIRYSHASFNQPSLRPHWGEPLFHESRRLLKEEFDHPSVVTAQTYVLLATYHLTFGGTRKAWMYIGKHGPLVHLLAIAELSKRTHCYLQGFARNIASLFKLGRRHNGVNAPTDEIARRLVVTIALMENLFTPSINIERGLSPMAPELNGEPNAVLNRTSVCGVAEPGRTLAIMDEILHLSDIHYQVRRSWQIKPNLSPRQDFAATLQKWQDNLPSNLQLAPGNFEYHREKLSLRRYAFMHLLQLHIQQLLVLEQLQWPPVIHNAFTRDTSTAKAYEQASGIASIVNWLWHTAQMDIHNASFGQIVTTAQVIHVHRLLSSTDPNTIAEAQSEIITLQDCLERVKGHCRLFNWVVGFPLK
ncbi:uncharacterized protein BJX67DRAFT_218888 [Aspergillus lucknowensis]|uniref:Zn(2)-C6 fungal-type domain-containing protein n=1 Tax=Aspergillus lucknowensis TaxID=176173 RepID=A0ABR4M3R1_9EURO